MNRRQSAYSRDWASTASYRGIDMRLVGTWQDLTAYYEGSDGNYWAVNTSSKWREEGPRIRNRRGKTLDGKPINSLPALNGRNASQRTAGWSAMEWKKRIDMHNHARFIKRERGEPGHGSAYVFWATPKAASRVFDEAQDAYPKNDVVMRKGKRVDDDEPSFEYRISVELGGRDAGRSSGMGHEAVARELLVVAGLLASGRSLKAVTKVVVGRGRHGFDVGGVGDGMTAADALDAVDDLLRRDAKTVVLCPRYSLGPNRTADVYDVEPYAIKDKRGNVVASGYSSVVLWAEHGLDMMVGARL